MNEPRRNIIQIEREIKQLTEGQATRITVADQETRRRILRLFRKRKYLLNEMFVPTKEPMQIFNMVNRALSSLSVRLLSAARAIDHDATAWIKIDGDIEPSIINLHDNNLYSSDFQYMIPLLSAHYIYEENDSIILDSSLTNYNYASEYPFLGRKCFEDVEICQVVHELCDHKAYSIPDVLRMTSFSGGIDFKFRIK